MIAKSHAGDTTPVTTTTSARSGLATESHRNGLLTSKSERHLNGDILVTWSPDADGELTVIGGTSFAEERTTYSYAAAANGTRVETTTAPDGATTISHSYRDGPPSWSPEPPPHRNILNTAPTPNKAAGW